MPPRSCTSNGRMWTERQAASRATAKAGTRMSSRVFSPEAIQALNSVVLPRSSSSERALTCGSISLISATSGSIFFTSRSCWLPKILVRIVLIIEVSLEVGEGSKSSSKARVYNRQSTRKIPSAAPGESGGSVRICPCSPPSCARGKALPVGGADPDATEGRLRLGSAGCRVVEDVGEGVDGVAVDADFVVQVVAG